jgi:hypothetical protein
MNKGFLIYVLDEHIDEPHNSYETLAKTCVLQLRKQFANIPIACVVWNHTGLPELDVDVFVPINKTLQTNFRSTLQPVWHNLYRVFANQHSPFEQTVMLDVDYWCVTQRLEWFFWQNFGAFLDCKIVDGEPMCHRDRTFGDSGVFTYWATVVGWKNTPKNNEFWQKIQQNIPKWPAIAWLTNQPQTPVRFDHLLTYSALQESFAIQTPPFALYHNRTGLDLQQFNGRSSIWKNTHNNQCFEFFNDVHLVNKQ